jgi:mitochondrial chaperone BCS1
MLIIWVSAQRFSHDARSSLASTDMTSPWGWHGPPRRPNALHSDSGSKKKKPLYYVPWNGRFFFWYRGHLLMFRRMQQAKEGRSSAQQEEVSISCFGRSPKVLKELLSECRSQYLKLVQNKTSVFEHRFNSWKRSKTRDIRQMSTVILDQKVKDDLREDIRDFLDPSARR